MRQLLVSLLLLSLTLTVYAGGEQEANAKKGGGAQTAAAQTADTDQKEAPQFSAMVKEGTLPSLEQRLPKDPMVIEPLERLGTYGGTLRTANIGGHYTGVLRWTGYENLVRWTPDWSGIMPNIAKSYEVSDDSSQYTFHLREGMKWSDGEPFTADAFIFWFEDIYMNRDLTPAPGGIMKQGAEFGKLVKLDDYTIRFEFPNPNGLFLQNLASAGQHLNYPRHYYSQFHITYNKDANKLAKENGFADWIEMFIARGGTGETNPYWTNAERPVITGWKMIVSPGAGTTTRAVSERNPYFWKVDTAGRQLPYIDRVEWDVTSEPDVLLLKVMNGEIDMLDQYIGEAVNKAVLYDNQDKGGYHFFKTIPAAPSAMAIQFNLSHPDHVKRQIFRDKNFRIGMSHAINRQEIIDVVFLGSGSIPHQVAPRPESDLYDEEFSQQYTAYDVAKANEYLDKAGLSKRDSQGFRLMPNGQRLIITFEIDAARSTFIDGLELMTPYWNEVGVDVQIRTMDRSLWEVRVRNNAEFDATIHRFGGGVGHIIYTDPRYYFPFNSNSFYAKGWATWFMNPEGTGANVKPEEPPADVKRAMELYRTLTKTGDTAKQKQIMQDILEIAKEQFYVVGVCTEPNGFGIVKNTLVNVPESMPWNWIYPHPAPSNVSQFFFDTSRK